MLFSLQPLYIQWLPTVWITNKTKVPTVTVASSRTALFWQSWRGGWWMPPSAWWRWEWFDFGLCSVDKHHPDLLTAAWVPLRKATSVPVWHTPTPAATGAQLETWTLSTCCSRWALPASATPESGFKCSRIDFFQLEKERNWFKQLWRNQPST